MPRIIVITDSNERIERTVTLDERVVPTHLEDDVSAAQLIERLGWAILDAEDAERTAPAGFQGGFAQAVAA
jgi:hypothetical protein